MLLGEAVDSVLAQDCGQQIAIVLVNDGCPLAETHQVCAAFAHRYAGKVFYLRRANGGLSAARNTGVRFALGRWASVEAIYLLDADNRLHPSALRQAHARMSGGASTGWVYPNMDMFGIGGNLDYGGAYSLLAHTQENICEAGSLISRRVFEAGVWFDETMRQGYEDWEFWLQAAARGFRGVHEPRLGLQYRKRAESMLSGTSRAHAEIIAYIRRKHPCLFQPRGLARLEARDAPRFSIYAADTGEIFMTGDPARLGVAVAPGEFERRFWQARAEPSKVHFQPFIVAASSPVLAALGRGGGGGFVPGGRWRAAHCCVGGRLPRRRGADEAERYAQAVALPSTGDAQVELARRLPETAARPLPAAAGGAGQECRCLSVSG
jgi:glycosyltransferase involved in cell wall biosynthesis